MSYKMGFVIFVTVFFSMFYLPTAKSDVVRISQKEQVELLLKASEECRKLMQNDNVDINESRCRIFWDSIACWPSTAAGQDAVIPCPSYINGLNTEGIARRRCTENGTWFVNPLNNITWADYRGCLPDFNN